MEERDVIDTFVFLAKKCNMILSFFFYSVDFCNMTLLCSLNGICSSCKHNKSLSLSRNKIK